MNSKYITLIVGALAANTVYAQALPMVSFGVTRGGNEKFRTIEYTDGHEQTIKPGGKIDMKVGVDYRFRAVPAAIQMSFGYHYDSIYSSNAELKFSRWPLEAIAYGYVSNNWRLGLGVRSSINPTIASSGAAGTGRASFQNSFAQIYEVEWLPIRMGGISLRFVNESFKEAQYGWSFDGSHVGIRMNAYF